MGLFKKLLSGADKIHDAKTDAEYALFHDRSFEQAEQLAGSRESHKAVITGIRGRYNDTTEMVFRLEWNDGTPRVAAVLFDGSAPDGLRLGSTVLVATDGDSAVLNPEAMDSAPAAVKAPGRMHGSIPASGVDDQARDMRVLGQLKNWTPERGTVESWARTSMLGIETDNWDIVVRRAEGLLTTVKRVCVPTYTRWFVSPGAELPIVVDPNDAATAQIDWPKLAAERSGGTWLDEPPAGSIAAGQLAPRARPAQEVASIGGDVSLTLSESSAEAIEGVTLERWALIEASIIQERIAPHDYDAFVAARFGVTEGRWAAIAKAWNERMRGDWRVGAAYGEAFEVAQRDLKQKR